MEHILFCKVSSMKYYKGACTDDVPYNGGKFVEENGYGHEEFNFLPWNIQGGYIDDFGDICDGEYCLGFVETKSTVKGKDNQLHIENILGASEAYKKESHINDITVVWCATTDLNETSVVGWYKNATIFRNYQPFETEEDVRYFNVLANASDCVLLPRDLRHKYMWRVPIKRKTKTFGFGQAMIWYAREDRAENYLKELYKNITHYNGDNWLDKFPEP